MIEMDVEIIGEGKTGIFGVGGDGIGIGDVAERDLAGDDEIAEQMRIGRQTRLHVDKEAVQRFGLFRRRQQVDVIAGCNRIGLGGRKNALIADHQRRLRPGRHEAAPEEQALRPHGIADQLLLELAGQIQLDAPRPAIGPRQRHMQPPRRRRQRPALQQQRDDHDDKGDVEIKIGL